jgi:hypothetical protein
MTNRPEEELPGDENKHGDEGIDDSTDMDGVFLYIYFQDTITFPIMTLNF